MAGRDLSALRKDGSEIAVSIRLGPIRSGDQLLACAVVRDVSQTKRIETALRDAEAHVSLLLDSTDEAIYGLDLNGNATFCNRACVEILGYEHPKDLLGKNIAADAQRAGEIIRRLRKFVQKRKTERCQVSVNQLVREVATFIEPEMKQENMAAHRCGLPVIIITGHADVQMSVRAFEGGAFAFLEKPVNQQLLLEKISTAIEQDRVNRQQAIPDDLDQRIARLTPREREVMDLLVAGHPMKQISSKLQISLPTCSKHRAKVLEKLEVDNDVHLALHVHGRAPLPHVE